MAAGRLIIPGFMPAEDGNGTRLGGAKLYFYENETTTLATVFTSSALTTAHTNPVVADANGVFPAIWADTTEEFTVASTDSDGAPVLPPYDNVSASVDATLASADLAEAAKISAEASADAAAESATDLATAVAAAEAAQAAAEAAAATAEQIAGFDPALYQLRSEEGQANGYAPLNGSGKIPDTHLTTAPVSTAQQAAIDASATASAGLAAAFAIALS